MGEAVITLDDIIGACEDEVEMFAYLFGERVVVTPNLAMQHADRFNFDWAASHLLKGHYLTSYLAATQSDREAFKAALGEAKGGYESDTAEARQRLIRDGDSHRYRIETLPARKAFFAATRKTRRAYMLVRAVAFAEAYIEQNDA